MKFLYFLIQIAKFLSMEEGIDKSKLAEAVVEIASDAFVESINKWSTIAYIQEQDNACFDTALYLMNQIQQDTNTI